MFFGWILRVRLIVLRFVSKPFTNEKSERNVGICIQSAYRNQPKIIQDYKKEDRNPTRRLGSSPPSQVLWPSLWRNRRLRLRKS